MPPSPKFKRGQREQERVQLLGLDSSDEKEDEMVQNQVTGVTSTMKDNITKVLEDLEDLEDLEKRSGELAESASQFRASSRRLERKVWWKNCKLKLILSGIFGKFY